MSKKVSEWAIPCAELNQPGNMYLSPKSQGPQTSALVSWENNYHWLWLRSYIENLSALTAYELKNATLLLT